MSLHTPDDKICDQLNRSKKENLFKKKKHSTDADEWNTNKKKFFMKNIGPWHVIEQWNLFSILVTKKKTWKKTQFQQKRCSYYSLAIHWKHMAHGACQNSNLCTVQIKEQATKNHSGRRSASREAKKKCIHTHTLTHIQWEKLARQTQNVK